MADPPALLTDTSPSIFKLTRQILLIILLILDYLKLATRFSVHFIINFINFHREISKITGFKERLGCKVKLLYRWPSEKLTKLLCHLGSKFGILQQFYPKRRIKHLILTILNP